MELLDRQQCVEWNRNDARADRAPEQNREIDRIEHDHGEAVFALQPKLCEHRAYARDAVGKLAISNAPRRIAEGDLAAAPLRDIAVDHVDCGIVGLRAHSLSFPVLPGSINGNACGTTDRPGRTLMRSALAIVFALLAGVASAQAEVSEVRLSKQYGLPYLPFMVMERFQTLEKQAGKQGLTLKVSWTTLSNATAMMDAILSGQMDFITPGVPTLATMWDKTVGTPNEIRALSAVQSMPYVLVTRSEHIRTIRDFTDKDRIALPAVKLTGHAIALQMAVAKEYGREHYDKLDAITLSLSHPDATAALLAGKSEINAHFASSPFYYIELATLGVRKVLHSYDAAGGRHTNRVVIAAKKIYHGKSEGWGGVFAA